MPTTRAQPAEVARETMPIGIRSDANAGVTASAGPFGLCGALMSRTGCPPQLARWLLWGTISLRENYTF